jgi:hypothetical protein
VPTIRLAGDRTLRVRAFEGEVDVAAVGRRADRAAAGRGDALRVDDHVKAIQARRLQIDRALLTRERAQVEGGCRPIGGQRGVEVPGITWTQGPDPAFTIVDAVDADLVLAGVFGLKDKARLDAARRCTQHPQGPILRLPAAGRR